MTHKIMVFIPTYNCEKQIPRVLNKISQKICSYIEEIVIIDNGSKDNTIENAIKACKTINTKIKILKNLENYNLGGSIKSAFLYAIKNNYDYIIVLHGDDQANINDLLPVLESGHHTTSDMIIGARFHPQSSLQGYAFIRRVGNRFLNLLCSLISRKKIYDLIAGLNCFKVEFLKDKFFLKFPNNLTFDAHLLLYGLSHNAQISFIPIIWKEEDQISNAKVFSQAFIILRLFLDYIIKGKRIFMTNKSLYDKNFTYDAQIVFEK